MNEEWKGLVYQGIDYGWRFDCSNFGRIRSHITNHIYKPHPGGIGYLQICTSINGIRKNIKVHKAVAESFIPNPNNYPVINHKNGNKMDNRVENLEWCTYSFNGKEAYRLGLKSVRPKQFLGEANGMSKLNKQQVLEIRSSSLSQVELAKKYNVSPGLIWQIKHDKIWRQIKP